MSLFYIEVTKQAIDDAEYYPASVFAVETHQDFIDLIEEDADEDGEVVWQQATGNEVLESFGFTSVKDFRDEFGRDDVLGRSLASKGGLDRTYYWTWDSQDWDIYPSNKYETYVKWHIKRNNLQRLLTFSSDEEAEAALLVDCVWDFPNGELARKELAELFADWDAAEMLEAS